MSFMVESGARLRVVSSDAEASPFTQEVRGPDQSTCADPGGRGCSSAVPRIFASRQCGLRYTVHAFWKRGGSRRHHGLGLGGSTSSSYPLAKQRNASAPWLDQSCSGLAFQSLSRSSHSRRYWRSASSPREQRSASMKVRS